MFEREGIEFDIIGILMMLFGIFSIGYSLYLGSFDSIFWFCYIGLIILGFGILAENGDIVVSQLNILSIPAVVWAVDFAYFLVFGKPLLGIADYFFSDSFNNIQRFISLQHIITLPLSLYCLSKMKFRKTGMWKFSFLQAVIIFGLTRFLTSSANNINYAFKPFFNFNFGAYYPLVWIALAFVGIFITNSFIIRAEEFNEGG